MLERAAAVRGGNVVGRLLLDLGVPSAVPLASPAIPPVAAPASRPLRAREPHQYQQQHRLHHHNSIYPRRWARITISRRPRLTGPSMPAPRGLQHHPDCRRPGGAWRASCDAVHAGSTDSTTPMPAHSPIWPRVDSATSLSAPSCGGSAADCPDVDDPTTPHHLPPRAVRAHCGLTSHPRGNCRETDPWGIGAPAAPPHFLQLLSLQSP